MQLGCRVTARTSLATVHAGLDRSAKVPIGTSTASQTSTSARQNGIPDCAIAPPDDLRGESPASGAAMNRPVRRFLWGSQCILARILAEMG